MSVDFRKYPRHRVWFPVQVDTDYQMGAVAACINASASGLLLRTPVELGLGDWVSLTFRSTRSSSFIRAEAEVVRVESDVAAFGDSPSIWPNTIAVQFANPLPKLELLFQCAEERQVGVSRRKKRASRPRMSKAG